MQPLPSQGLLLALAAALALALAPSAAGLVQGAGGRSLTEQIRAHRAKTWHWQRAMGVSRTPTAHRERDASFTVQVRLLKAWKHKAAQARRRAHHPPHKAAWECIHRHEGAWTDPDPPYWGGLQMDLSFQRAHGSRLVRRKGTANHWTLLEQMWVAERAYRSGLGFSPWPNTAADCGL